MMKKLIFLLIPIIVITITGCSKNKKNDLKFYIIERDRLSTSYSDNEIIKAVKNEGRLAYTGDDIEGYNWQTHTVTLKQDSISSLGAYNEEKGGSAIFKTDDTYVFVLLLKDKLIYYGGFEYGTKNPTPPIQPYIQDLNEQTFKILFDSKYAEGQKDNRSHKSLYAFLQDNALLSSKNA